MPHHRGFTLLEVTVIVLIIALLIGILLPVMQSPRRTARSMQNSTHSRGIHSGMVLYSQGNKDWYPGLDPSGVRATASIAGVAGQSYGTNSTNGYDPAYRFAVLLRGNYFSPEYMQSPSETNTAKRPPATGESLDSTHFSYAMLRLSAPATGVRRDQWRANMESLAPVISDRNIGSGATGTSAQSVHTAAGDGWRGSVCFNDNHAVFETSDMIKTTTAAYTPGNPAATPQRFTTTRDGLFADDNDDAGNAGNDAAMVHQDETTYVDQK